MRIARFLSGDKVSYGVIEGNSVRGLSAPPYRYIRESGKSYRLSQVKLLAPCLPSKIVAIGLNYRAHAKEAGRELPKVPLMFLKPPTAVIGPEDNIRYPAMTTQLGYEGELGVVMKKAAWHVPEDKALDYVLGYTCVNDVSARDIQASDGQWTRAKGFDTFAPMGPWIETEAEPGDLMLETYLNGALKQHSSTNDLIFNVPHLISFASQVMTLLPGDVIATGTPSGVGLMQVGDTVEVKIAKIGTLRNRVAKGE